MMRQSACHLTYSVLLAALLAALLIQPRPAYGRLGFQTQGLRTFRYQWFNPSQLSHEAATSGELTVTLGGRIYVLEVTPNDMRGRDLLVVANGETPLSTPPVTTYKGFVRGVDSSLVRLDIRPDRVEGYVRVGDDWWFIEPVIDPSTMTAYSTHLVYQAKDIEPLKTACGVSSREIITDLSNQAPATLPGSIGAPAAASLRRLEIATDSDYYYYLDHGANSAADVQSILNQVEGIYESQLGVTFDVVFQNVWTTPDPYSSTDPATLLGQFTDEWKTSFSTVQRDLTHLFSGRNLDGSVIGIAWVGTVCNKSFGYGLSQDFTTYTGYLIALTAHELGHNFAASHDTNLPATIMYPSVTDTSIFSSFSIGEIASYVSGLSENCLNTVTAGATTTTSSTTTTSTTTSTTTTTTLPGIDSCQATDPAVSLPVTEAGRRCQERMAKAVIRAFSTTLRAMEKCLKNLQAGKISGDPSVACRGLLNGGIYTPPTESRTNKSVQSAIVKLQRTIERSCTDAQIANLDSCGTDRTSAVSCLAQVIRTAALDLSVDAFGQSSTGPLSRAAKKCQSAVQRGSYKFAKSLLKARAKCLNKLNRGRLTGDALTLCLENRGTSGQSLPPSHLRTATTLRTQIERLNRSLAKSCSSSVIGDLDTCSVTKTLPELQTCLLCTHSEAVLNLIGYVY